MFFRLIFHIYFMKIKDEIKCEVFLTTHIGSSKIQICYVWFKILPFNCFYFSLLNLYLVTFKIHDFYIWLFSYLRRSFHAVAHFTILWNGCGLEDIMVDDFAKWLNVAISYFREKLKVISNRFYIYFTQY